MEAQGLHHPGGFLLELPRHGPEGIGGKQLARVLQAFHLRIAFFQFRFGQAGIFRPHGPKHFLPAMGFKHGDDVIGNLVHHVHPTGAYVQHDVIAAQLILMNHKLLLLSIKKVIPSQCAHWRGNPFSLKMSII